MSKKKKLFHVKDHLVSGEFFELSWNQEKKRAETNLTDNKELSKYYHSDNYDSHKKKKNGIIDLLYFGVQKVMFKFKENLLVIHKSGNRILDYGSGVGSFAQYLSNKGYKTTLIEPLNKPNEIAKKKNLKVFNSIQELPMHSTFSCITLWHVLEHLPNPERTILRLKNLLELNGIILVALPNFNSFDSKYYEKYWAALDVPRHLWHYTSEGIINTLESSGFEFIKKHPLLLDSYYISMLSEKYKKSKLFFLKGLIVGFVSNFTAIFTSNHSSSAFVFKKRE